jgi:hypothetical protein
MDATYLDEWGNVPDSVARPIGPGLVNSRNTWLDRPLSTSWCALGWICALAVFILMSRLLGGPSQGDVFESVYSTWAIAHGHLSCAYYPDSNSGLPLIAPLYPLLSGGLAALAHIGSGVPFPSQVALGPHCSSTLMATFRWSVTSGAPLPTYALGYVGGPVLMGGVVALLRATGRGRRVWEPTVLVMLACIPTVWTPLVQFFHPQDLVAMGLALGGLACARRDWWFWAGVLLGLAVTSQQFVLLALVPLVVVAPKHRRNRFVGAATGTAALVVLPVLVATSGRAFGPAILGSGNTRSFGGTVLWELHLHGALLVGASRIAPILMSMLLAWWALRRLGPSVREPLPLVSLVATSLGLRLVFEQNLFGYYFMALTVSVIMLDVIGGRIRGQLVAWIALVALAFSPVRWGDVLSPVAWGLQEREFLPFVGLGIALILITHDVLRGRMRTYIIGWFILVALAFGRLPWLDPALRSGLATWFWQVVLVSTGLYLASRPLRSAVSKRSEFQLLIDRSLVTA